MSRFVAIAVLVLLPRAGQAGDVRLRLPSWVTEQKVDSGALGVQPTTARPKTRAKRIRPARRVDPAPSPRIRRADPAPDAVTRRATFSALKLLRVNQSMLRLCDRIAYRRGEGPPRRIWFRINVDANGGARVDVGAPVPIAADVARCYRTLAGSWTYPATGSPYAIDLSRIAPGRR